MTRSREAKRRRNRKTRERWRRRRARGEVGGRVGVWQPPAATIQGSTPDQVIVDDWLEGQRELLEEITDGENPKGNG